MAENYDQTYQTDNYFGEDPNPLLERFGSLFKPGIRVLDIGIGQGRNAIPLARHGCQVEGIDPSQVAVDTIGDLARKESLKLKAHQTGFIDFQPGHSFDVVLCFGLLQVLSLSEAASLIERLHSWTLPGGAVFFVAWHVGDPGFDKMGQQLPGIGSRSFGSPGSGSHRFYLNPGEILDLFPGWDVKYHWEGLGPEHRHGDGPQERHGDVEVVLVKP